MEKILTVNDVAAILQVKAITVREMFREKRLRGFKVGKAWRTTESMLQEDISALARGESPAELPTPEVQRGKPASAPESAPTPVVPPVVPMESSTPAPKPAAAPQPAAPPMVKEAPKRKPPSRPAPTERAESDTTDEDTQQMLF